MSITIRSAQTIKGGLTLQSNPGISRSYRYWKFSVTRIADPSIENNGIWQISELVLKYRGLRIDYTGATASSTDGASFNILNNEGPGSAIDSDINTKFTVNRALGVNGLSGLGYPLIIDFGRTVKADSMTYYTANDDAFRDPIDWILWGSADGTNWDPVQLTQSYTPPSDRQVESSTFYFQSAFAHHLTLNVYTGGVTGDYEYQAWTRDISPANTVPVGATALGTNLYNHIGGIYTVTDNNYDGVYAVQKITVVGAAHSINYGNTNVGSNEPFEIYWN